MSNLVGTPNMSNLESGACDKDAPDPVEAVLSGREAEQEGQVHQGRVACTQSVIICIPQFNAL